jgi:phosphatidylserine/phosphatidylglycerophosphate/cardiolipin synthase-like enzyme
MNKLLAAIVILALSFTVCSIAVESDGASGDIVLYEIKSAGTDEGFSLYNTSSKTVDLKDYSLADNGGKITFTNSLLLGPNESITIVQNDDLYDSYFINHVETYHVYGKDGITAKNFSLNDTGDYIYLYKGETIIDAFFYGNATVTDKSLWTDEPYEKMSKKSNDFAVRSDFSTSSAKSYYRWGVMPNYFDPDLQFDAKVTPFLFPNSGGIPIFDTLEKATKSVYITMYELTNTNLYGLLQDLQESGVKVTILLEKNPLGYSTLASDAKKMKAVIDAGGEVRFIGGDLSRYTYVHAKYCIIDEKTVIVTSENWVTDNLNGKVVENAEDGKGNRGWGAIVESKDYASYMMKVFENDYSMEYGDVITFEDYLPNVEAASIYYQKSSDTYTTSTYAARVTPAMSPTSSLDATYYYIDKATSRVYSQQQSITSSYLDFNKESPLKHLATQASNGLDVKFILNSAVDTEEAKKSVAQINMTSKIKAAAMSKPYVHNKGVISDNTAFVSSVNWTTTSFTDNREMCIAISSKDVADFYAAAFTIDFDKNYIYSGLDVTLTEVKDHYDSAGEITASAKVEQTGTFTYEWDLDGSVKTTTVDRIVLNVTEGKHILKVKVTDSEGNQGMDFKEFTVSGKDPGSGDFFDKIKPYLAPIAIVLLAIIAAVFKLSMGNNKKKKKSSKGKKGKKR